MCSRRKTGKAARETGWPFSVVSLRAQRSNPESFRGGSLDCFAALAMTMLMQAVPTSPARPRASPPRGGAPGFGRRVP
nr:hypothetical protein FNV92_28605 [Bradyrhizobium cosmicum]